jgi:hypothetical protein
MGAHKHTFTQGVETTGLSLEDKQALITGSVATAALVAAIQNEGYEAELL